MVECLRPKSKTFLPNKSTEGQEENIVWRLNGEEDPDQSGSNHHVIQLVESLGRGNYTCHRQDGSLLNHTLVLVQETQKKRILNQRNNQEDYLNCSAQNYNGEFRCSWEWYPTRPGRVVLIRAGWGLSSGEEALCSGHASGQQWTCVSEKGNVTCSVDSSGRGISCQDKQQCPYAEEIERLTVFIYVTFGHMMEEYTKQFFISDIVKPDQIQITKMSNTTLELNYPHTWSSPSSFFPLTFQVREIRIVCQHCVNVCADSKAKQVRFTEERRLTVQHKVNNFCVRAQDALSNSQWSEWSHYRRIRLKLPVMRAVQSSGANECETIITSILNYLKILTQQA
ncbi:interleukin 12Ba precursor [Aplochiton taeniatus]